MSTLDLHRLDTVQVVPPTPFSADGRDILADRLAGLVEELDAAGISVFLPAAGTGEFHSLSAAEVAQCVATTRRAASAAALVVAPIGFGVEQAVETGKKSLDAGADALLLMPVVHPYVCDDGFRDYLVAISQRLGVPLLTYKRGPAPSDRLLLELARSGRLLGVKYAVNDVDAFARLATEARQIPVEEQSAVELGLYCGTAERWAPYFMAAGATGYTSGTGCLAPRTTLALHRALATGDAAEARRMLAVLRPLEDFRARDGDSFNIAALKYAVGLRGLDFGPCRPPQRRVPPDAQDAIRSIVETLLDFERSLKIPQDGK